jgi:hypothetical protein
MSSEGVRSRIAAELWYVSNCYCGGVLREAQDWFQAEPQSVTRRARARCRRTRATASGRKKILRFPSLRIGPSLLQINL